ncbi:MAG TPA: OmpA family protein [Kofleriaceae bacterium]|nr:OmpA family protein [Kofleriaceae bacterium]
MPLSPRWSRAALLVVAAAAPRAVAADPSSGVDAALFRPSYDTSGLFSLEGARLPTRRDLSWKMWLSYADHPFDLKVPGIGGDGTDHVLRWDVTLDFAFGFTVSERFAVGLAAAVYRADTGPGYGQRGRFNGTASTPSTGLISLRPLSNMDPSGGFTDESLSGPLDVRVGGKYMVVRGPHLAATVIGTVVLPFGEDELFLGDHNLVFEPRVALDWRFDRVHATKLVANLGARFRQRTVLQVDDDPDPDEVDRKEVLDIGSELQAGVGATVEVSPKVNLAAEGMIFLPLPASLTWGQCLLDDGRRCAALTDADRMDPSQARGDRTAYAVAGAFYRLSPHVTANAMASAGFLGARGDDVRVTLGGTWSPQPESEARAGRGDRDKDGVPDVADGCPDDAEDQDGYQDDDGCPDTDDDGDGILDADDHCREEPEDRDGYQDDDGCPERDNDGDGIDDLSDRCPDQAEDVDGFEDDDGCPDPDNDGDGILDGADRCPNDKETPNGVDDDDGCPDAVAQTGPVDVADHIDLRGNQIEFAAGDRGLAPATKVLLGQVASLIRDKGLTIRIEVHVARGTTSKLPKVIARQAARDKLQSQKRAKLVLDYLVAQGVPLSQLQAVGLGSDRPLGSNPPEDPINDRVDLIKAQQRTP